MDKKRFLYLIKGTFSLFFWWLLFNIDGMSRFTRDHFHKGDLNVPIDAILSLIILYQICKGIFAFHAFFTGRIPMSNSSPQISYFNGVKTVGSYQGVDRAYNYRESMLSGMPPEKAAELYKQTQILDAIKNGHLVGHGSEKAIEFLDGKLQGLSYEDGIKYLLEKEK